MTHIPPPAWDSYDAYLLDIDGTLLNCTDAVHYFAFCEALGTLAGRPLNLDGVLAHGNTDNGILRDALLLAHIPEEQWRPHLPAARQAMCSFVEERIHDLQVTALPGVPEVLDRLASRNAILGVATGNLEGIGRAKLDRAGLLDRFHFGGYSDAFEYRRDVFGAALDQARALAGNSARVCVVGDTPEDIRSAQAHHLDIIAVATGIYSIAELERQSPTRSVANLRSLLD